MRKIAIKPRTTSASVINSSLLKKDLHCLLFVCIHTTMNRSVTLRVDLSSTAPAYRQIVDGLRLLMVNGDLRLGDTLPTVRSLALDLGVHFSTVAEAYRTLSAEGWLDLKRHHGAFVTERRSPAPAPETQAEFGTKLRQLIAQGRADGLSTSVISKELELLARELPPSR